MSKNVTVTIPYDDYQKYLELEKDVVELYNSAESRVENDPAALNMNGRRKIVRLSEEKLKKLLKVS